MLQKLPCGLPRALHSAPAIIRGLPTLLALLGCSAVLTAKEVKAADIVQSGGVLTGPGPYNLVIANDGSTIRAGDRSTPILATTAAQRMTSIGGLVLNPGSLVEVRADASGVSDSIAVVSEAEVTGARLKILASPQNQISWAQTPKTFTVLTARRIYGSFETVETDYALLRASASLAPDSKSITATLSLPAQTDGGAIGLLRRLALSPDQYAVATVLEQNLSAVDNPLISRVLATTAANAPVVLQLLSGPYNLRSGDQIFTSMQMMMSVLRKTMWHEEVSAQNVSVRAYAENVRLKTDAFDKIAGKVAPIPDGRVWADVLGGVGRMKSDGATPGERATNYGLAAGADTALTSDLRAGFALSFGQSTTRVNSLPTKIDGTWGYGSLFAVAKQGDFYGSAALVYGYVATESERVVTALGSLDKATGKFGSNVVSTRFEAGRKFRFDGFGLSPYVSFEPTWLWQNAYRETGSESITLGFNKSLMRAMPATLGLQFNADCNLGDVRLTPSLNIGWIHQFAGPRSISPFFTALPGSSFTLQGAKGDRNLALTELNLEARPEGSLASLYINARADTGHRASVVRGTAGMSLRF